MGKEQKILVSIIILGFLLISNVGAGLLTSDAGVRYDSGITEAFNNITFAEQNRVHNATNYETLKIIDNEVWLKVIVRLKDESGTLPEQVDERIEWFEPVIDEVLVTLNEREFKDIRRHSDGFSGLISKEGFDKLVQDERVWEINWPRTGFRAAKDETQLRNWIWIAIIIFLFVLILCLIIKKERNKK